VAISFDDAVQRFIGTSLPTCLARVADLLGGRCRRTSRREFAQRTRDAFAAGLTTVPGVEAVLDALTVPYCVASNGNRAKVDFTLGHTGLRSRFEGRIFTADDVLHPKPAPDLFLHAARTLGATRRAPRWWKTPRPASRRLALPACARSALPR
jgi:HAD superfamily hydrolase (TIGR01509 family)